MTNRINLESWLNEMDISPVAGQPDPGAGQAPASMPGTPGDPMAQNPPPMPQQGGPAPTDQPEDISNDPQHPDMPEESQSKDFEQWKIDYMKESIKGDPNVLEQKILEIRDKKLDQPQRKFVEDNLQICFLRRHPDSSIFKASQKIRKYIKQKLDKSNPGTALVNYIYQVIGEDPLLNQLYIKLVNQGGGKQDLHRKLIASLLGAVQVGSGAEKADLIYNESDYSIPVSTRFNMKWGDVDLGDWFLQADDLKKLKEPELERLKSGSPEERDVLRRRVIMESIAEKYRQRAFVINSVNEDGTVQHVGLDLGNLLGGAYLDGKLKIRTSNTDVQQMFIDEDGSTINIPNIDIYYVKTSSEANAVGQTEKEEVEFISNRNGRLFLRASIDVLKECATNLQGIVYQETPWQGNPSDLFKIMRCIPSISEILLRDC
jgi:hypothetical protein